jgi:hypothetical protein
MLLLPLTMAFVATAIVYFLVRDRVRKPQEWAAGGFFVYYAFGWFAKLVYEAIADPQFGAPPPAFIVCGLAGATVFGLIVRARAKQAKPS